MKKKNGQRIEWRKKNNKYYCGQVVRAIDINVNVFVAAVCANIVFGAEKRDDVSSNGINTD